MRPDLITSRRVFATVLTQAVERAKALQALDPTWSLSAEILRQLDLVGSVIRSRRIPTAQEKSSIDLGPLAVRNLDDSDDEFSTLLKEIYFHFKHYEELPP
ncbi:MAG: hypothetical protein H0W78_17475 [Planctomycetes bacterium]|nr:hypothetical protein [Planctomycetota bacterium]